MKWLQKEGTSSKNVPMLLLLAAGVIEFLFITLENQFSGIGYYLAETYVIVPCLLLLGYVLQEKRNPFARRRLLLAGAAVGWFVIVQCIHKLSGMENHPMATVFFVYLMAFPFASLTDDRKNAGLWCIGGVFIAAALVLVGYSAMLLLDLVPGGMEAYLYWDGARLHALWHPNVAAGYFMISIGFSLALCFLTRKKLVKALLAVGIALQLMAMALTNCRTTLLLTGAMLGGTVFFLMCKGGGWKRMVLGLLTAAVLLTGCFKLSGMLFQWNNDRLLERMTAVQAEPSSASDVPVTEVFGTETIVETEPAQPLPAETAEVTSEEQEGSTEETAAKEVVLIEDTGIILGDNEQRSLADDMRTLNGRTLIWQAALKAIRNDKKLALWGTEYSGTYITVYSPIPVVHAHNSWMETLMRMGLPGLMMSLVFTALSVWSAAKLVLSPETLLWKKIIAMLAMCVMASGFLEPYLFLTNVYYHVTDFIFFFLTGYLDFWSNRKENL